MASQEFWRLTNAILLAALIGASCAAAKDPKIELIRGSKFSARIVSFPAEDQLGDNVEIVDRNGHQLADLDLSRVGGSRCGVYKAKWSNDGNFFVASTTSFHSTWHTRTFVFGVNSKQFFELDEYVRPVVEGEFSISGDNWISVSIQNAVGLGLAPPLHVKVDLAEFERVASQTHRDKTQSFRTQ